MHKVKQSNQTITPFGGLNFIYDAIKRAELDSCIDKLIGYRHIKAKYSYSDIVLSLFGNSLCQGEYISDLSQLKNKFSGQLFSKIPSADTVEYACQELKQVTVFTPSVHTTDVTHEINYNTNLNNGLVSLCVKAGLLEKGTKDYTLDFDNVVIATEKQDAKMSYKNVKGYHPNLAFIGSLPVHIENHNGNTPARYQQTQTLTRCFDSLEKEGISIAHFRADSASYQKEVIDLVNEKAGCFYIRISDCANLRTQCAGIKHWETIEVGYIQKEVASILYAPFGEDKTYRVVVTRVKKKTKQIDIESATGYDYYGIITNNDWLSNKNLILFYNQRGDAENSNRYLLNDFNLHHLPFSDMNTNTVYMYLMAMSSILFDWVKLILVMNKTAGITLKMRVKAICFHYITVATKFVEHARQKIIQVFSPTEYSILKI